MSDMTQGIAWKDELLMGNEKVDTQHRRLFELVNDLVESCTKGHDPESVKKTLDFLVDYAVQHFYDEELLQVESGFPEFEAHRQMHEDFKVTVGELVQKFVNGGSSAELSSDVNRVVVKWLISHILREDKKIGVHIRSNRLRSIMY